MFKRLQNETIKEIKRRAAETKKAIKAETRENVLNNWRSDTRENITALRFEQLKDNKITLKQVKKIALKKLEKTTTDKINKEIRHFEEIASARDLDDANISVSWTRSSIWGMNPHAEMYGAGQHTSGSASGCGYDKLSAATAQALNDHKPALKALYKAEEKRLKIKKTDRPSRRDYIGYGSGYGVKPYYEGGVGESSHIAIFKNLGYTGAKWYSYKSSDLIIIEK